MYAFTHKKGCEHAILDTQVYSTVISLVTWEAYDQCGKLWQIYVYT